MTENLNFFENWATEKLCTSKESWNHLEIDLLGGCISFYKPFSFWKIKAHKRYVFPFKLNGKPFEKIKGWQKEIHIFVKNKRHIKGNTHFY